MDAHHHNFASGGCRRSRATALHPDLHADIVPGPTVSYIVFVATLSGLNRKLCRRHILLPFKPTQLVRDSRCLPSLVQSSNSTLTAIETHWFLPTNEGHKFEEPSMHKHLSLGRPGLSHFRSFVAHVKIRIPGPHVTKEHEYPVSMTGHGFVTKALASDFSATNNTIGRVTTPAAKSANAAVRVPREFVSKASWQTSQIVDLSSPGPTGSEEPPARKGSNGDHGRRSHPESQRQQLTSVQHLSEAQPKPRDCTSRGSHRLYERLAQTVGRARPLALRHYQQRHGTMESQHRTPG